MDFGARVRKGRNISELRNWDAWSCCLSCFGRGTRTRTNTKPNGTEANAAGKVMSKIEKAPRRHGFFLVGVLGAPNRGGSEHLNLVFLQWPNSTEPIFIFN
jgi:hypothetical protein